MMNKIFLTVFAFSVFNCNGAAGSKPSGQMIHRFHNPGDEAELKYTSGLFKTGSWKIDWLFYPNAKDEPFRYLVSLCDNSFYINGIIIVSDVKRRNERGMKYRFLAIQRITVEHGITAWVESPDIPDIDAVEKKYETSANPTLIIDLLAAHNLCHEHDEYRAGRGPVPKPYSNSTSIYRQRS